MTEKQLKAVRKYIKQAYDPDRQILSTIQINQGKQFMLNGYTAVKWNSFQSELNEFLQTPEHCSIRYDLIVDEKPDGKQVCGDNLILWNNLKKYKKYLLQNRDMVKDEELFEIIFIFDKYFDINQLLSIYDIVDFGKEFYWYSLENEHSILRFHNENVVSAVLPVRFDSKKGQESKEQIKSRTEKFLEWLKTNR